MGQSAPRAAAALLACAVLVECSDGQSQAVGSAAIPAAAEVLERRFGSTTPRPQEEDESEDDATEHEGDLTVPLHIDMVRGGGGSCVYDVDCGWIHPSAMAEDRRNLPSGNGAKCLVGRCVCNNEFENKYGCERCTVGLQPTFSYGNGALQTSTKVWDKLGRHINLCDLPTGGAKCEVGICARDADNKTLECPGDRVCDSAGSGSGICVGHDGAEGYCACAKGFYCQDCSLHELDILEGATCDKYVTGGAFCHKHDDCRGDNLITLNAGYCALPAWAPSDKKDQTVMDEAADLLDHLASNNRAFCKCDRGWTCRRCEHKVAEVEREEKMCLCDTPRFQPDGGNYNLSRIDVSLTAAPWDSDVECELRYQVQRVDGAPTTPPWPDYASAVADLSVNGTQLRRKEDGTMVSVRLQYDHWIAGQFEMDKKGMQPPQIFYIYAVTVPRPNTTWSTSRSRLVRSQPFIISSACPRCSLLLALVLAACAAQRGAASA